MRRTKTKPPAEHIEPPHPSEWKTPEGVFRVDYPQTDADWLLSAANYPTIISSNYWWLDTEYCDWLRRLIVEVKEQHHVAKKRGSLSKEFVARYEEHRRIFAEVPFQKYLMPSYDVILTQSSPNAEAEKRHRILAVLLDVMQRGELDYLRVCPVCQQWFIAAKSDAEVCSKACRQKKSRSAEEKKEQRKERDKRKKEREEFRKKVKTKAAQRQQSRARAGGKNA